MTLPYEQVSNRANSYSLDQNYINQTFTGQPSCPCLKDIHFPSYNTVINGNIRQGVIPAGTYAFTREGKIFDYCSSKNLSPESVYATTSGPRLNGPTVGSCLPRASQNNRVEFYAGSFDSSRMAPGRKCF